MQTPTQYTEFATSAINTELPLSAAQIAAMERLATRLQYRFLELDSKLRFLRLLSAGTMVDYEALETESNKVEEQMQKLAELESKLEAAKSSSRSLRKKIGRCLYQNEVRKCLDGKKKLLLELKDLEDEIYIYKSWFEENGIIEHVEDDQNAEWIDQIPQNLSIFQDPRQALTRVLNSQDQLANKVNETKQSNAHIDTQISSTNEEIELLKAQKINLQTQIEGLENRRLSLDNKEAKKIERIGQLKKMLAQWEQLK